MDLSHRSAAAPTAVLAQAISRFEQDESSQRTFVAAPRFQGARPGYYFGRGSSGVGYYLDPKQEQRQQQRAQGEGKDAGEAAAGRQTSKPVNAEELLREAEEAAGDAGMEMLDARGLKRLTLALERKYNANLEARMKYAEQPDKFMESEADLDEAVKAMMVVASAPDLYPELVRNTSAVPTLLTLLNHENSDIAADAVEVLSELTDADAVEDAEEEAVVLVESLMENDVLSLLVHRLSTFNEKVPEEASAVYNVLSIIENIIEVKPDVAELVLEKTKLLKWLLSRLRSREVDSNKQYASEVLAILVQQSGMHLASWGSLASLPALMHFLAAEPLLSSSTSAFPQQHPTLPVHTIDANKRKMGTSNGIDAVLQAIAPYRNRDPETTEEEEFVENLFDTVASCLLLPENKAVFVEAEGVELLLLILKSKRVTRTSALKCLDFATTRCPAACDRVVDQQGLKTLFAIFMGKLKVKRKDDSAAGEEEQRTVSIISSLLCSLAKQSRRDRVAAKFVENEFEKCDRLMEIYFRYEARVAAEETRLAAEAHEELDEDDILLARMDAGLYTLQQTVLVVGALWLVGDMGVRKRILRLLHQKGRTLATMRSILEEYRSSLGDDGGEEERKRQLERTAKMLVAMGGQVDQDLPPAPSAGPAQASGPAAGEDGSEAAEMEVEEQQETAARPTPSSSKHHRRDAEQDGGKRREGHKSSSERKRSRHN